jgi:hypothetical protein
MRLLKYLVLLAALTLPAAYSQAQIAVGVQYGAPIVDYNYGPYGPPPVCEYGYYSYYPYACAPYGYWGPEYFADGFFIGVGPWNRFYFRHPEFFVGRFGPGFHRFGRGRDFDRGFEGRRSGDRDGFRHFSGPRVANGFHSGGAFRGGEAFHGGGGIRGGNQFQGGMHQGGGNFHGGGGFHSGGGFQGGGGHSGGSHGGGHSGGHR